MRTQTEIDKRRESMRTPAPISIGGRNFYPKGSHADGTQVLVHSASPDNPPSTYHFSSPDPRNPGKRLFWIFVQRTAKFGVKYIIPGVMLALGLMQVAQSFVAAMERSPLW